MLLERIILWFKKPHSVVDSLTNFKQFADSEYTIALDLAHDRYRSAIKVVEESAHDELKRIEALAKHAAARVEKLLHSDLLHENHVADAAALHTVMQNIKP